MGLSQLCGFVESFSALHYCRLCLTDKTACSVTCIDDNVQIRTTELYTQQPKCLQDGMLTTRDCGIKSSCLLNSLSYFHTVENVIVDVMHDFF